MLPTINTWGDLLAVDKWQYSRGRNCEPGHIVAVVSPVDAKNWIAKRIIGMPGDIVCMDPSETPETYLQVPSGHVWVTGDNLEHSLDSRAYGPVPMALIRGRVFARLWPSPRIFSGIRSQKEE